MFLGEKVFGEEVLWWKKFLGRKKKNNFLWIIFFCEREFFFLKICYCETSLLVNKSFLVIFIGDYCHIGR